MASNRMARAMLLMLPQFLAALAEYERQCTCIKGEGATQQLTPGCPVHWPHAPEPLKEPKS